MSTDEDAAARQTTVERSQRADPQAAHHRGRCRVWRWEEQLVRFGTRYTGSPGHVAYVDWLAGQLSAVPGFSMRTDRLTFNRWLARQFTL